MRLFIPIRIRKARSYLMTGLALLLGFGGLTGCGENAPMTAGESLLVPAHSGANTPITVNNAQAALLQAFTSFSAALPQIAGAAAGKPAAPKVSGNQSIAIPDIAIDGKQSGRLVISNAQLSFGTGGIQTLQADLIFDDFSEDGQLFIGGPVRFELSFTLFSDIDLTAAELGDIFGDLRVTMAGDLGLSGTYSGTMSLDVILTFGESGVGQIDGAITLNGQTIELSGI